MASSAAATIPRIHIAGTRRFDARRARAGGLRAPRCRIRHVITPQVGTLNGSPFYPTPSITAAAAAPPAGASTRLIAHSVPAHLCTLTASFSLGGHSLPLHLNLTLYS